MLYWLDLFGVFVFALSGALAADRRGMDLFGFIVIAFLPAVGGGTVRDIVIGTPVFWVEDAIYVWIIIAAAILTFLAAPMIHRAGRALVWADAIGLSVFSAAGAAKAYAVTANATVAIAMGVVTAVFGGIVRDVVCNEIPLVLRQDIYATAAFAGSVCLILLLWMDLPLSYSLWGAVVVCFGVRASALIWGWRLPRRGNLEDG